MYLYSRAMATLGSVAAYSVRGVTSTTPAMLVPQWQMYTPTRGAPFPACSSRSISGLLHRHRLVHQLGQVSHREPAVEAGGLHRVAEHHQILGARHDQHRDTGKRGGFPHALLRRAFVPAR